MPEKIIYAQDTAYVSRAYPWMNNSNTGIVKAGFSKLVSQCQACINEEIGLLQFEHSPLPDDCLITRAVLHLFVYQLNTVVSSQIHWNLEPFDVSAVNWMSKPPVVPQPASTLWITPENTSGYVTYDITQWVKRCQAERRSVFGVSILVNPDPFGVVTFSTNPLEHPAYVSMEYDHATPPPELLWIAENQFFDHVFELEGTEAELFTRTMETANAQSVSFFVKNIGDSGFDFNVQISPDGTDFLNDAQKLTIEPDEMKALTPYLFARYMRVRLQPASAGQLVKARVWCQIQTHNYTMKRSSLD